MPEKSKYTNATFTKRVDHEAGRHRPARAMSEPAVCEFCGAIYVNRRWSSASLHPATQRHEHWRPAQTTICPACVQISTGEPRGFVYLDGAFVDAHTEEIQQLVLNESKRALEDNPLARIMDWKRGDGHKVTIATTTEHLAQRLGHAVQKAFGGNADYDFSHENKLARVSWQRD
jgi:hypothetical protein